MKEKLMLDEKQMKTLRDLGIKEEPRLGSGFTAQELLKLLPKIKNEDYVLVIECDSPIEVSYYDEVERSVLSSFYCDNLLTALFMMVVWERKN